MTRLPLGTCLLVLAAVSARAQPAAQSPAPRADVPVRLEAPRLLPGTPAAAFSTIQGNALDSADRPLPQVPIRLRDARLGRIADSQLTDRSGLFAFRGVDPGSYVVELLNGARDEVLAASPVLSVNPGDVMSIVIKLPLRRPPPAGLLDSTATQAVVIATAAAATGVLAASAKRCVSPPCQ